MAASVQGLVDSANLAFVRLGALYFDARMRTVNFPFRGSRFVSPAGNVPAREVIRMLEPLISSRKPAWTQNPDNVPRRLKDARLSASRDTALFAMEPDPAANQYLQNAVAAGRHIARVLGETRLGAELNSPITVVSALARLLDERTVGRALQQEEKNDTAARRSAGEAAVELARRVEQPLSSDPGFGIDPDLGSLAR